MSSLKIDWLSFINLAIFFLEFPSNPFYSLFEFLDILLVLLLPSRVFFLSLLESLADWSILEAWKVPSRFLLDDNGVFWINELFSSYLFYGLSLISFSKRRSAASILYPVTSETASDVFALDFVPIRGFFSCIML